MALPSCSLSVSSTFGHFGLLIRLVTPQSIALMKPLSTGLFSTSSGDCRSDVRVGMIVLVGSSTVQRFMLSGRVRKSIQIQAASCLSPCENATRLSPAIVVLHPASPSGSGAVAHLPSIFGNSSLSTPASHAPAMYMPTLPLANATRPSYELEFR